MAILSKEKLAELAKKPANKTQIDKARLQEQRLRFHCEPILEKDCLPSEAMRDFTAWARSMITTEKFVRFAQLLRTPLDTVTVTKDIFNQLSKFLDAQDRFIKYEFVDSELQNDFNAYLERIGDPDFWRTHALDALRIGINSLLVVDLPATQSTPRPEPYYYKLSIDNVVDLEYNDHSGDVEYVIFKQDKEAKVVVAIDGEFYRTFTKDKSGNYNQTSEAQHSWYDSNGNRTKGLGYTPAVSFYSHSISDTKKINKRGPITDVLSKLDWLLFFTTIAKYYFEYGPFPIIVSYELEKNEFDEKRKEQVDSNVYIPSSWSPYDNINADVRNPKTDNRHLIGAGSTMTTKAPKKKDDFDPMANPIKIIEMSVDNLDWVKTYVEDLGAEIAEKCTGEDGSLLNAQAKNQDQIQAAFERKVAILDDISENFERAHKFVVSTLAKLRYNPDYVVNIIVDYGGDYFLKDATTLTDEYAGALKANLNIGYTSSLRLAIINTKYKNNPDELARQKILLDLEPYPDLTWMQMQSSGINVADPENYVLKLNFTTFINQFERYNGNVVEFGSLISYNKKIETISKTLKSYGKGIKYSGADPAGAGQKQPQQ